MMNDLFANVSDRIIIIVVVAVILGVIRLVKRRNLIAGNILQFIVVAICTIFLVLIVLVVIALLFNARFHFWF